MSGSSSLFPTHMNDRPPNSDIMLLSLYSQLHSRLLFDQSQLVESADSEIVVSQLKPQHSYIGLIAKAILSTKDKRMLLSEVYDWIADKYPYFRYRGTGWRNSIRHNLSLNDCFVKESRAPNGKGHYWAIHPANLIDFAHGDFRRKHAQWRIKSHDVRTFTLHSQSASFAQKSQVQRRKINCFNVDSLLMEHDDKSHQIDKKPLLSAQHN